MLLFPIKNRLIKQGARLLSTAEDILDFALQKFLPDILKNTTNKPVKKVEFFVEKEQKVLEFIKKKPSFIEEIVNSLKMPPKEIMQIITSLELKDAIREETGGIYYPTQ